MLRYSNAALAQGSEPDGPAQEIGRRERLARELRDGLAAGQLELEFQPVIDVLARRFAVCEALVRWRHPERGLIVPGEFIPIAEERGLIAPIGAWVLRRACAEAMRWPDRIKVAVNVSPLQCRQRRLVDDVRAALEGSGLPARRLELEITESTALLDTAETRGIFGSLKQMGLSFALDDFGKGYSSLDSLAWVPLDRIKLDKCLVWGLGRSADRTSMVRAVIGLCAKRGLSVTAEGVEIPRQMECLLAEGVREMQGHLMSKARPATAIADLLRRPAARLLPDESFISMARGAYP